MRLWDLIVVGGGPAGLSAALVARDNHLSVLVLERGSELGGQVRLADHPITDLLGRPAQSGAALARDFAEQIAGGGAEVRFGAEVVSIAAAPAPVRLGLSTGEELHARRVFLATGAERARLGVPGEHLAEQKAHLRASAGDYAGRRVVVIGGGDEASDIAAALARAGAEVVVLARSRLRARPQFRAALEEAGVWVREGAVVVAIEEAPAGGRAAGVQLASGERVEADAVVVRAGAAVRLPSVEPALELQPDGRVKVDRSSRTSVPAIFAGGDLVLPPPERYIAVAAATGVLAARAIEADVIAEKGSEGLLELLEQGWGRKA